MNKEGTIAASLRGSTMATNEKEPASSESQSAPFDTFVARWEPPSGSIHTLDFYLSDKKVNSFRVHVDGELWKKQISASRTLAALRKELPRFVLHG